jgi:type I restriction enzyme S subunit
MTVQSVSLGDLLTLVRRKVDVVAEGQYPEIGVRSYGRGLFHKQPRSGLEVGDKELRLVHEPAGN